MKRLIPIALITAALCFQQSFAVELTEAELSARAAKVEAASVKHLSVSIRSIALLLEANEMHFMPKWSLERSGEFSRLKRLHDQGYVRMSEHDKLPSGQDTGEIFVRYVLTPKGAAIVSGLGNK
jgi:hypothetical protein